MTDEKEEDRSVAEDPKENSRYPEPKSKWKRRFRILIGLLIIALLSTTFMLEYVKPNEFGIKVVKIGVERGVHKKVYSPGFHFVLPYLEEMHRLPRNIQVLELTNHPEHAAKSTRIEKAAHIQTSDGFFVDVDVSILYRISDPYKVFTIIGRGNFFEENGIIPQAEPKLKDAMGELTTEEFYNSPLRVEKTDAAKEKLNKSLNPKGIKVEQVLVRYFIYSKEIQKNIEEKKLKDQLVFKNQAEARAATEEAILKKVEQEGMAAIIVELEKGKAYTTQRNAEKDLYVRKQKAEADLLVKLAEAERVRLKNKSMQGLGAERMVGLKMAEVYRGLDTVVLPSDGPTGVNPLDLDNTLNLFGIRKGGSK
jgi:regulator of protease activity HflC (stomatin/prohibitin superfamily)